MVDKKIREIADVIDDMVEDNAHIFETRWDGCIAIANSEKIASELLKHYQIADKNSVILSREEWREYIDNENEAYYRGQYEVEVYYKNIQIPRERKETAEKILKDIRLFLDDKTLEVITKYFKEILGVEIKELMIENA